MASITVRGRYDQNTGQIVVSRTDLWGTGAGGADGLRRRLPDVETSPFVFSEKLGLRPQKRLTFKQLRILETSMPAARTSIDFIKNRMMSYNFRIVKTDGSKRHNNFSQKRADRVRDLMAKPNQFGQGYRTRISMLCENFLQRDLGTVEKEPYPAGGIRQWGIVDSFKMRPNPQNYQGDLSAPAYLEMDTLLGETIVNTYRRDEMVWSNLNPQAGGFYGFAPLEVLDTVILMSIHSTRHNLKLVHPNSEKGGGIVYLGDVGDKTRKEFEERYTIFRTADPGRLMFTSGGEIAPTYLNFREKSDMDWPTLSVALAEIVASCFQLNLRAIGMTVKGGSGGTAEVEDKITQLSAIIPRMLMLQEILTVGLVQPAGGDDLALEYVMKREETLDARTRAASVALGRGIINLSEARDMVDETLDGLDPKIGKEHVIIVGNNVMKVKDIMSGKIQMQNDNLSGQPQIKKPGEKDQRITDIATQRGVDRGW